MLDFYYINDCEPTPEEPNEDDYVDSFRLCEFMEIEAELIDLVSLGVNIDFFKDNRIIFEQVQIASRYFKEQLESKHELVNKDESQIIGKFISITDNAIKRRSGLVLFCD